MTRDQIAMFGALAVLGVTALYYMRGRATVAAASGTSDTTHTNTGGINTTPLNSSALAWIEKPFGAITEIVRRVAEIPSAVAQGGTWDRSQAYDNPTSAAAAFNAPIRPDYVPTIRARENIIYTVFGK
jgi:hypothetical protein